MQMLLDHAIDSRTQKADVADLLRMDDDGGMGSEIGDGHPPAPPGHVGGADWGIPLGTIPGEREPGPQVRWGGHSISIPILSDWPMSAATIADRRREGGGAPRRRRANADSRWSRIWRRFSGH